VVSLPPFLMVKDARDLYSRLIQVIGTSFELACIEN